MATAGQLPPELELLEEVLLELELELEELLLVASGHGSTLGPTQPQIVVLQLRLMTVLMLFTFGPPSGETEIRFNSPI